MCKLPSANCEGKGVAHALNATLAKSEHARQVAGCRLQQLKDVRGVRRHFYSQISDMFMKTSGVDVLAYFIYKSRLN